MKSSSLARVLVIFLSLLLACLAIFLGLRLAGAQSQETVLGRVAVSLVPSGQGTLEAYVPLADWGVRAHPFTAPVTIRIEPRGLDRQALLDMASRPTPLLSAAARDLRAAIIATALSSLLWIALAAILLTAPLLFLLPSLGLSRRWLSLPLVFALTASLAVGLLVGQTFSGQRLERVDYWARGGELPGLLRFASQRRQASAAYQGSVERGLGEFAAALSGRQVGRQGRQAVLLSDLHNNTLVLPAIKKLAADSPVFLVGDLTHEGGSVEQRNMLRALRGLGRPLVVVSGNHDSRPLMNKLAAAGAIVLTERGRLYADGSYGPRVVSVSGLKVAGVADPNEGLANQVDQKVSELEKEQRLDSFQSLVEEEKPDLLLVHDSGLAARLASRLRQTRLVILTGHNHRQEVARYGKVVVINAGSAGAGGLFGLGREQVGFARLYLDRPTVSAVDLIRQEPFSGDGQAERVLLSSGDSCRRLASVCYYYRQK